MAGAVIGAKGLDAQHPLLHIERLELFDVVNKLALEGAPEDMPIGFPIGQLIRVTATLKKYQDLLKALAACKEDNSSVTSVTALFELLQLAEKASALLDIGPPIAQVRPAGSRIILP